jgi:hypothetical protein
LIGNYNANFMSSTPTVDATPVPVVAVAPIVEPVTYASHEPDFVDKYPKFTRCKLRFSVLLML